MEDFKSKVKDLFSQVTGEISKSTAVSKELLKASNLNMKARQEFHKMGEILYRSHAEGQWHSEDPQIQEIITRISDILKGIESHETRIKEIKKAA